MQDEITVSVALKTVSLESLFAVFQENLSKHCPFVNGDFLRLGNICKRGSVCS